MERRAVSEDDVPTVPAFPVPVVRDEQRQPAPFFPEPPAKPRSAIVIDTSAEAFFAVGRAVNDNTSSELSEDDLAAIGLTPAQRRRDLSRFVLAVVVVCLGILGASVAHVG